MEEAHLLKERLQAITDKRRVQEDIAKKRREIEEEKLKLQYLKKKSLREQWLMDGLSPQSEQDQEAMKVQVEGNQQKTKLLQSNIDRIDLEIEALETQEMTISTNEGVILKRLKEVERTAEDIIKEVNAGVKPEPIQYIYTAIPDIPRSFTPILLRKISTPVQDLDDEPSKEAIFAMEISVERDMRTGESQVVSTATVTPQEFQQKGVKVYDDGRKSVYALRSDGQPAQNGVGELSPLEVEELLRKATDKKVPTDVAYHQAVFSSPYSRPSTPRKAEWDQGSPTPNGLQTPCKSPSPYQPEAAQSIGEVKQSPSHIPNPNADKHLHPDQPVHQSSRNGQNHLTNGGAGVGKSHRLTPVVDLGPGPGWRSPFYSKYSSLDAMYASPSDLDTTEPVTMIFMGYQNAESDEEDEIQAELVVIGDDDDEEDNGEAPPSYHPEGYRSKVYQPSCNNVHRSEVRPGGVRHHTGSHTHSAQRSPHPEEDTPSYVTAGPTSTELRLVQLH